jgi:hypothetical protein
MGYPPHHFFLYKIVLLCFYANYYHQIVNSKISQSYYRVYIFWGEQINILQFH